MVGAVREDDLYSSDSSVNDDVWIAEGLNDDELGRALKPRHRNSRRSIEELMEQRRLREQLEDVFEDDF